jgi:hypothetical protein
MVTAFFQNRRRIASKQAGKWKRRELDESSRRFGIQTKRK